MSKNGNLHKAKKQKNDEFYTQLSDIENELRHYKEHFRGKVVFCNCDDPYESNFFKYFAMNFNRLGLKKLITTGYVASPVLGKELAPFEDEAETPKNQPYAVYINEVTDINGDGRTDLDDVRLLLKMKRNTRRKLHGDEIYPAGDFRSAESIALLKQADIVVTNPPFSLFRDYVEQLIQYDKHFLIIGNKNAVTYKEIFPLIKDNKLWVGTRSMNSDFWLRVYSDSYEKLDKDGNRLKHIMACWFTNLDIPKRHEILDLYKEYNPEDYPKYDNYDAINVDKVSDIPCDYNGVMGVPITFLDKYNPEQFEIVSFRKGEDGKDLVFTGGADVQFNRTFVSLYDGDSWHDKKCRRENQWEDYLCKNNNQAKISPIDYFFPSVMPIAGCMNSPKDTMVSGEKKYARILIKRKAKCHENRNA